MKNIKKGFIATYSIIILFVSAVLLTACSQPTNTPVIPASTGNTSNPTSPTNPTTPTSPENPSNPTTPQQRILMILSSGQEQNFAINTWEDIDFAGSNVGEWISNFTSSSDCEIEIMEQGNSSNINLQAIITATKVSIKADKAGIVYFRVKNNRANIVSNYTAASFVSSSVNTNNPGRFYGTWVTTDIYLVDTITFSQNGTGEQYNSNYPTSRTSLTWSITNANTIYISGGGSSCNATFSFSGNMQTLTLTNFWDYNQPLTFIKQ